MQNAPSGTFCNTSVSYNVPLVMIFVLSIFEWPFYTGFTVFNETVLVLYQRTASVGQVLNIVAIFSLFIQIYASMSKISWRLYIPCVPKHMKRFESHLTQQKYFAYCFY